MADISEIRTSSIPSGRNHSNPEVKPSVSQKSAAAISNDIKSSRGESSKTDHSKISICSILFWAFEGLALGALVSEIVNLISNLLSNSESTEENTESIIGIAALFCTVLAGGVAIHKHRSKNK